MKKLKQCSGFSLIEMLVTIVILVLLVMGIDTGMNAGMRIYNDSIFYSHSSALDDILATSMGDILRYSKIVCKDTDPASSGKCVFTNYEYGALNASFDLSDNVVVLKNESGPASGFELFSRGAYPDLKVTDLSVTYKSSKDKSKHNSYFTVEYNISKVNDTAPSGSGTRFKHVIRTISQ